MKENSRLLRALRGEAVDTVPVWYMRQAGRYDPDYRKIKQSYTLLEICKQPELAAQVTMLPIDKLGVDAAILYSDIMNPVDGLGIDFDIVKNVGPVIDNPIKRADDVYALQPFDAETHLPHVLETIRILERELQVPLIGFAGAPFTIASYLIEGKPTRKYHLTKQFMFTEPDAWQALMDKLGDMAINYLQAQIQAGANVVQLFDSWVGELGPVDFERYVLPTIHRIFDALSERGVPTIYFPGVGSGELLPSLHNLSASAISIDWRVSIPEARRRLASPFTIQGNLDPLTLTAPLEQLEGAARRIIDQGISTPGYVFNLGHGLFPEARVDRLQHLTEFVHEYSTNQLQSQK